jgi:TolA-binding protein
MRRPALRHVDLSLAVLLVFAVALPGCFWFTSRSRGNAIEARATDMAQRLETLEKQLETDRREYTELIQKAEGDVVEIEAVLGRATRAAADSAADTENFRSHMMELEGSVAELKRGLTKLSADLERRENSLRDRVEVIAAKVGLDPPLDPADIPQEPAKLLEVADAELASGDPGKARSYYRAFVERHPTDDAADDVQLKIGRSYATQSRHAQALTALNVIVDRYPESNVMGETLVAMAESLYQMRSCNDAITLLQAVLSRYRDETLVQRARTKLREVQRSKKQGCRP